MLCPGRGLPVLTTTGSGSLGAASSESDAGSVLFRGCGCSHVQLAADSLSVVARSCGRAGELVGLDGCEILHVIRVPECARVSRCLCVISDVMPGRASERARRRLSHHFVHCVHCDLCSLCVLHIPPVSFYRYVSCVSRLPPVSLNRYRLQDGN